jgi:DNA-binding CsgD family transcriptional regulator
MVHRWLTRREREVLRLVAGGRTTAEIAARLGITAHTVESHVRSVRVKLGVPTRAAAVAWLPAPPDPLAGPAGSLRLDPVVGPGLDGLDPVAGLAGPDGPDGLDPVAAALLDAVARGVPVAGAARDLHVSLRTAHRRLRAARQALGVATTTEAVARWCTAPAVAAGA